jgi:hypothetical protein
MLNQFILLQVCETWIVGKIDNKVFCAAGQDLTKLLREIPAGTIFGARNARFCSACMG